MKQLAPVYTINTCLELLFQDLCISQPFRPQKNSSGENVAKGTRTRCVNWIQLVKKWSEMQTNS